MADSPLHKLLLSGWRLLHHFLLHLYNLPDKRVNQLEEGRKKKLKMTEKEEEKVKKKGSRLKGLVLFLCADLISHKQEME